MKSHALFFILALVLLSALLTPATAEKPKTCSNTNRESWSPGGAPAFVVTVSVCAEVLFVDGHFFGVHSISSSANTNDIRAESGSFFFEGERTSCVTHPPGCNHKSQYFLQFTSDTDSFPNKSKTSRPFSTQDPLSCAITILQSFTVVYKPTGETHTFSNVPSADGVCAR
jgi:hypothetical protein